MNKSKRKLSKIGKLIIFIIILIAIISMIFIIKHKKETPISIIEQTEYYDIKIDYTATNQKKLDKEIEKIILNKKNEFTDIVEESKDIITNKYDLIINAQTTKYQNIYFTNIVSNMYTGGAHYIREDNTIIFDGKDFININYFLENENNLEEIKLLSQHYLKKYADEKELELDDEWLNKGTETNTENYQHFYLSDEGLTITFVPYQIAPWSYGEIKITLPYKEINKLLKKQFRNSEESTSDVDQVNQEIRDLKQFKNKKLIAFTFDDGPNTETTSILLDGLKKYNAKVTFFVLGSRVAYHKNVLLRAFQEGNEIGSHTYNHRNLLLLDDNSILSEIENTNQAIKEIIGIEPTLIRPPYGNTNSHIKSLVTMHTIHWNIDSLDWQLKNRELIKEEIVKYAHDGAIVLLHDIYRESVEGALLAMAELEKEGYAFVTISEMAKLKEKELDYTSTYFGF